MWALRMEGMYVWLAALALALLPIGAYAHTVDSVDNKYRLEIGWINEPVVSGEANGIELFISTLDPCPDDVNSITCALQQEFRDGITGVERDIKIQLVYRGERITLPILPDHNKPGGYYVFVVPSEPGFYQANLIGDIRGSIVSLSMHPPKVGDPEFIKFPAGGGGADALANRTAEIGAGLDALANRTAEIGAGLDEVRGELESARAGLADAQEEMAVLREAAEGQDSWLAYPALAIALGGVGVAVASIARRR